MSWSRYLFFRGFPTDKEKDGNVNVSTSRVRTYLMLSFRPILEIENIGEGADRKRKGKGT